MEDKTSQGQGPRVEADPVTIAGNQVPSAGIAQNPEIRSKLDEKLPDLKCAACGAETWNLADELAMVPVKSENRSFPCVVLLCANCGFTQLHNALILGLGEALQLA